MIFYVWTASFSWSMLLDYLEATEQNVISSNIPLKFPTAYLSADDRFNMFQGATCPMTHQEEENHHKARVEHICLKGGVNELLTTWINQGSVQPDAMSFWRTLRFDLEGSQGMQPSNYCIM